MEWIKWKGPSIPRFASCPMQTAQGSTRRIKLSAKRSNDLIWNLLRLGDVQVRWCIEQRGPAAKSKWDGSRRIERGNKKYIGEEGRGGREETRRTISLRASFVPRILSRGPLDAAFSSRIIDTCPWMKGAKILWDCLYLIKYNGRDKNLCIYFMILF